MDLANIKDATEWFEVLQTSKRTQTALSGRVGPETVSLKKGDVLLIRAGTPHRFENPGRLRAVTFNVYSPPEYPQDTNG